MPLSLLPGSALDLGRIAAGLLGLFLLMLSFGAAGLFVSSLTREATIAAVGGFGLLMVVWLIQILGYQENRFAEMQAVLGPIVRREIVANRVDEWKEYVSQHGQRASDRIAVLSREMAMWEQKIPPKYRK